MTTASAKATMAKAVRLRRHHPSYRISYIVNVVFVFALTMPSLVDLLTQYSHSRWSSLVPLALSALRHFPHSAFLGLPRALLIGLGRVPADTNVRPPKNVRSGCASSLKLVKC